MLHYTEHDGFIHLYVNAQENEYPISLAEFGAAEDWNIFMRGGEHRKMFRNVSKWVLHLAEKRNVSNDFLNDLSDLIKIKAPSNRIDWAATFKFITIRDEYRNLMSPYFSKNDENIFNGMGHRMEKRLEIIELLIKKHDL